MMALVAMCSLAASRGAEAAQGTDKTPDFTRDIRQNPPGVSAARQRDLIDTVAV
jgi:hypothetical protein